MHRSIPRTSVVAALTAAAVLAVVPAASRAAGTTGIPFADAFDRALLVVVATVDAAPPGDPAYRLAVTEVIKGEAASSLAFPADQPSVTLVPGTMVVLLAMDPGSLDFRGTWTLAVAPDGTIDPDGLVGVPATVDELIATYGAALETPTAPAASGEAGGDGGPGPTAGGVVWLPAVVGIVGLAAAVAAAGVLAVRRRRRHAP